MDYNLKELEEKHRKSLENIRALQKAISDQEQAIARENETFKTMAAVHESLGSGDWSICINSKFEIDSVEWSSAFRKLLGYTKKSLPNKFEAWENLVHDEDKERVMQSFWDALHDPERTALNKVEYRLLTCKNGYQWFRSAGMVQRREDGSPSILRGVLLNINRTKTSELALQEALREAEESNRAKTTFLFNMSHDIRTPMNAILGFTHLASENVNDAQMVAEYLSKIQVSSKFLLSLINDILDMSRIESGNVKLEVTKVNLAEIFRDLDTILRPEAEKKNLAFSVDCKGVKDSYVYADPLRIGQILLNLTSNAVKFTKKGSVRVSVSQLPRETDGLTIYEIRVKDTGVGVGEKFKKKIYEPFAREMNSTQSGVQGTGLGMAITKKLVDMMEGSINFTSRTNIGTEFVVRLPLEPVENDAITDAEIRESEANAEVKLEELKESLKGKRVLYVEDNPINQEIGSEILKTIGVESEIANDGVEAVSKMKAAREDSFDFVLMDIQMPNMNGYEACKEIRKLKNKKIAKIPIFAVTANVSEDDRRKSSEAGMDGHIAKPVNVEELVRTVAVFLNSK